MTSVIETQIYGMGTTSQPTAEHYATAEMTGIRVEMPSDREVDEEILIRFVLFGDSVPVGRNIDRYSIRSVLRQLASPQMESNHDAMSRFGLLNEYLHRDSKANTERDKAELAQRHLSGTVFRNSLRIKGAKCIGMDPEIFFPSSGESSARAIEACKECVGKTACLDFALKRDIPGIWGGTSERERKRMRRQIRQRRLSKP